MSGWRRLWTELFRDEREFLTLDPIVEERTIVRGGVEVVSRLNVRLAKQVAQLRGTK